MPLLPTWMRRRSDLYTGSTDVVVYQDDNGYAYALDTKKKKIIAGPSTDHASVIQEAWDYIDTGIVFVRSGIYYISKTLWLKGDGKGLVGEIPAMNPTSGVTQPFDPSTYVGGVLFVATNTLDYVVRVGDAVTPTQTREPLIGNISVHGNAKASVGIRFEFLTNGLVFNIWSMHNTGDGIQISGSGGYPTSSTHFMKLRSVGNGDRGLYVDVNTEHCLIEDVLTVENSYHGMVLFGSGNTYIKMHAMNDNQGGNSDGTGIKFAEYASALLVSPKIEGDSNGHPEHGLSVYPNADNVALTVVSPFIVRVPGTALGLGISNRNNCRVVVIGGAIGDSGTGIWIGSANTVEILVKGLNGVNITTPLSIGTPDRVVLDNVIINNNKTINSGKYVTSGDGTTTQFSIPHGLVSTPNYVVVTPCSVGAMGSLYVTVDSTNIYVNYSVAPPAGTNNVCLYWEAEI